MTVSAWRAVFFTAMVILALLLLPKIGLADSSLYQELLTPVILVVVGSLAKLAFLAIGAVYAARCSRYFEAANPVRPGWLLLACGLALYAAGQASLGLLQLVRGSLEVPYPSVADLFFVLSMTGLFAALTVFVFAYRSAGYLGEPGRTVAVALVSVVVLGVLLALLLRPVLAEQAPAAEQALNVAYPVLDCLLLLPTLILLRMAMDLRGGRLVRVWVLLLSGFLLIAAGDVLFAYFATLGLAALDPVIDLLYAYAYILLAWGTVVQHSLLSE